MPFPGLPGGIPRSTPGPGQRTQEPPRTIPGIAKRTGGHRGFAKSDQPIDAIRCHFAEFCTKPWKSLRTIQLDELIAVEVKREGIPGSKGDGAEVHRDGTGIAGTGPDQRSEPEFAAVMRPKLTTDASGRPAIPKL